MPARQFSRETREYIALTTGLRMRHDLGEKTGEIARRGWIGLALRKEEKSKTDEIASAASAESVTRA